MSDTQKSARGEQIAVILLAASALVLGLALTNERTRSGVQTEMIDSLRRSASLHLLRHDSSFAPGDTLPHVAFRDSVGTLIGLHELSQMGQRVIYFGRSDCPGCLLLDDWLASSPDALLAGLAIVHLDTAKVAIRAGARLSSSARTTMWPLLQGVPSAVLLDSEGRVLSIAHVSARQVAKLIARALRLDASAALAEMDGKPRAAFVTPGGAPAGGAAR